MANDAQPPADETPTPSTHPASPARAGHQQADGEGTNNAGQFEFVDAGAFLPRSAAVKSAASKSGFDADFWALAGCNAVVFLGSVCIMVLELTASRLVAKHVGQSLYTWTSVIGIVLAGITVGNFIGGWAADRFVNRRQTLAWLFLLASVFSGLVLVLDRVAGGFERGEDFPWPLWVVWIVSFVFLAPAIALGTVSPVAASLALSHSHKTGRTVGNVYAWGALGSIVGTFLTGFWLIDAFGSRAIVGVTAVTLAVIGVCVASRQWVFRTAVLLGWLQLLGFVSATAAIEADTGARVGRIVGGTLSHFSDKEQRQTKIAAWETYGSSICADLQRLGLTLGLRDDYPGEYHDESNYSYVYVGYETADDGDEVRYLRLDTLTHSYFNPNDPTALYYEYEQVYAAVTERVAEDWDRETTVALGEFPGREDILNKLPAWIRRTDADDGAFQLRMTGALSVERREDLLKLSPQAGYWGAIEDLRDRTNADDFGGWTWIDLPSLPEGVTLSETDRDVVRYDATLRTLNAYGPVDKKLFDRLIAATPDAPFYRAVHRLFEESRRTSAFFIGGGGFIFPRWIEERFPDRPRIDVAELDPAVKLAVQSEMGLAPDGETAVNTLLGDARRVVDDRLLLNERRRRKNQPPIQYDFVYGDAFNDFSVPWHLTTVEFSEKIRRLLHPERGVFLINVIDIYARSEYPRDEEYAGDPERGVEGIRYRGTLPKPLRVEWNGFSSWQQCPPPFESLEVRDHEEGGEVMFSYRGRMSQEMEQRLIGVDPQNAEFVRFIRALARRTRTVKEGRFLGRYVNSLLHVFPNVYVFSSSQGDIPAESRDTLVLVASMQPLNLRDLRYGKEWDDWYGQPFAWRETDPKTGRRTSRGQLDSVVALAEGKMLTDDFAPVDNLLIPVFLDKD